MQLEIAIVQFKPILLDIKGNLQKAINLIHEITTSSNPKIILFPELFLSGYTFKDRRELDDVSFPIFIQNGKNEFLSTLIDISKEKSIGISGGYSERDGDFFYNSSFFIGDGQVIANYRKTHLFHDENDYFQPGDTGFRVFEYNNVKFGMMICFDWIFPESARTLALMGAQIILHPANLVLPYCQRAMYARAIENRVFIATANRVGKEVNGKYENSFTGGSQIVSPRGEYILTMNEDDEYFDSVKIDPNEADDKNITEKSNLFKTRREEFYR